MAEPKTLMTAEELERLPGDGHPYELVRAELRTMAPAGPAQGVVAALTCARLVAHVEPRGLGYVLTADPGFFLERDPDTVLAPDVAFIAAERFSAGRPPPGFADVMPDLVVEVVSPSQTGAEVRDKVRAWLEAGVRLVWAIYPTTCSMQIYRSLTDVRQLTKGGRAGWGAGPA